MKNLIIIFIIFGLTLGIIFWFTINFNSNKENNSFSSIKINESVWDIEIADTLLSRIEGLSNRVSLNPASGLLFIFPENGYHGIWMKEMKFSIDIIWFDENFVITHIKEDAKPESYPESFNPSDPSRYVLEINAGEVKKTGIKIWQKAKIF